VGRGFGVPLVLRYIPEFCTTADEGDKVLQRVLVHMAYSVIVLDRAGHFFAAYLAPDRPTQLLPLAVTTNHQRRVEWQQHARHGGGGTRALSLHALHTPAGKRAGSRPVHPGVLALAGVFDCLRSGPKHALPAVYRPTSGEADHLWPNWPWRQSFAAFDAGEHAVNFLDAANSLDAASHARQRTKRVRRGVFKLTVKEGGKE
jgi:hypothetical protein